MLPKTDRGYNSASEADAKRDNSTLEVYLAELTCKVQRARECLRASLNRIDGVPPPEPGAKEPTPIQPTLKHQMERLDVAASALLASAEQMERFV